MKIDYLALKRICIAQGLLDPHLLWNAFSNFTKKKVQKMLDEIIAKNAGNPPAVEQEVSNLIQRTWSEGPRRRRTAFLLLMMAKNQGLISSTSYKNLRESMGVTEYSPEMKNDLDPKVDEKKEDIFDVLMGNSAPSNAVNFPNQEEKLPIAASIKK